MIFDVASLKTDIFTARDTFGDEWPCRPLPENKNVKEDAICLVVSGCMVMPVYADDDRLSSAHLVGITKAEFFSAPYS